MSATNNHLDQRIIVINKEARLELEKIAINTIKTFKRNRKKDFFDDLEERGKELAHSLEKAVKNIVDHANKVMEDFEQEISNIPDKEKYVEKLRKLLEDECMEITHLAKDKAIEKFNS